MANPQAISVLDKLRDEMAAHPDDSMISTVGEILTAYAGDRPEAIGALVTEEKTLAGAIGAMRAAAMKQRKGTANCVAMTMTDGMAEVLAYFGLPRDDRGIVRAALSLADNMPESARPAPARAQATAGLDLDTLLGL